MCIKFSVYIVLLSNFIVLSLYAHKDNLTKEDIISQKVNVSKKANDSKGKQQADKLIDDILDKYLLEMNLSAKQQVNLRKLLKDQQIKKQRTQKQPQLAVVAALGSIVLGGAIFYNSSSSLALSPAQESKQLMLEAYDNISVNGEKNRCYLRVAWAYVIYHAVIDETKRLHVNNQLQQLSNIDNANSSHVDVVTKFINSITTVKELIKINDDGNRKVEFSSDIEEAMFEVSIAISALSPHPSSITRDKYIAEMFANQQGDDVMIQDIVHYLLGSSAHLVDFGNEQCDKNKCVLYNFPSDPFLIKDQTTQQVNCIDKDLLESSSVADAGTVEELLPLDLIIHRNIASTQVSDSHFELALKKTSSLSKCN